MRQSRPVRLFAVMIALVSIVFMQLAVAAYACPAPAGAASAVELQDMQDCEGMHDLEQPALCFSHSQVGNQSLDKPPQPPVAPFTAVTLVLQLEAAHTAFAPLPPSPAPQLSRRTAPPLAIAHCCFRT